MFGFFFLLFESQNNKTTQHRMHDAIKTQWRQGKQNNILYTHLVNRTSSASFGTEYGFCDQVSSHEAQQLPLHIFFIYFV